MAFTLCGTVALTPLSTSRTEKLFSAEEKKTLIYTYAVEMKILWKFRSVFRCFYKSHKCRNFKNCKFQECWNFNRDFLMSTFFLHTVENYSLLMKYCDFMTVQIFYFKTYPIHEKGYSLQTLVLPTWIIFYFAIHLLHILLDILNSNTWFCSTRSTAIYFMQMWS